VFATAALAVGMIVVSKNGREFRTDIFVAGVLPNW
jgi:hypothetical protein